MTKKGWYRELGAAVFKICFGEYRKVLFIEYFKSTYICQNLLSVNS